MDYYQEETETRSGRTVCPAVIAPIVAVLEQLESLLFRLTDEQYAMKPVGVVASSIGGHIRHNLDHIHSLLTATKTGELNYDHRERGTNIESSRQAALDAIQSLQAQLVGFPWCVAHRALRLRVLLTKDQPAVEVMTTLERELAFVLSHTIHHNSLISVMAKLLNVSIPAYFGYAPSTIVHREAEACAR